MINKEMPELKTAINAESWEWVQDNAPVLAAAVVAEVKRGATADEVRRFVMRYAQRPALALRLEQAAAWLAESD